MQNRHIIIIGGGACGISAFTELFLQCRIAGMHRQVSITVIEENEEVGKGLAFGTKQPGHILNTQADLMGIHLAEPAHFSEWLVAHEARVSDEVVDNQGQDEAFTTRRLYGDYLQEQFEHYFELARREGMDVKVVRGSATGVRFLHKKYEVQLQNGEALSCDYVILAPGTPVGNTFPDLEGIHRYFDAPWPSSRILKNVPQKANVGILGSSLSAIDALMTLADNEHEGNITFYSLDGMLPRVQVEKPEPYECTHLTIANLHQIQRDNLRNPTVKEVFRLFMQEAETMAGKPIDWKATRREGQPADILLKEDIRTSEVGGDALMNIPYALRYQSSDMWKMLEREQKITFKKWLGGYWSINRHGMPLVNARRIERLFDSGQLKVVSKTGKVSYDENADEFVIRYEGGEAREQYLINATGPASAVKDMKSELVQNLAREGMIEAEPAGGIRIDTDTMQVIREDKPVPGLYALGHLANGLLLDVNAVWFNVRTIGNLCGHLIKTMRCENPD